MRKTDAYDQMLHIYGNDTWRILIGVTPYSTYKILVMYFSLLQILFCNTVKIDITGWFSHKTP